SVRTFAFGKSDLRSSDFFPIPAGALRVIWLNCNNFLNYLPNHFDKSVLTKYAEVIYNIAVKTAVFLQDTGK
ncbi:MAG: hypothetical protein LUD77_00040, partial [Clostridiales bacterium]|nr:hypothetical protein [Clostridiales bacterium]